MKHVEATSEWGWQYRQPWTLYKQAPSDVTDISVGYTIPPHPNPSTSEMQSSSLVTARPQDGNTAHRMTPRFLFNYRDQNDNLRPPLYIGCYHVTYWIANLGVETYSLMNGWMDGMANTAPLTTRFVQIIYKIVVLDHLILYDIRNRRISC